jgi:hypothetical protein
VNRQVEDSKVALWRQGLAGLLWVLTAALSVVMIPMVLDVVTRIYAAFWSAGVPEDRSYWSIVFIRQMLTIPLAIAALVIIIGGAEYHLRHVNTERSWTLLTGTLALEVAVLLLALTL